MTPDCVWVARPSARVVQRVDPAIAEAMAARPRSGAGALAVGPRRILPTLVLVCAAAAASAGTVLALPRAEPVRSVKAEESFGLRHWAPLPWELASVPAPAAALVFCPALLALAWLRRSPGATRPTPCRRAAASPRGFLPSAKLAGRGGAGRRAPSIFGGRR